MIIKVCGMKDPSNMKKVIELGIDWMGMVFYGKSPRYIFSGNHRLPEVKLISGVKRVGVFVNEEPKEILRLAEEYKLDIIQLHGTESPATCKYLQSGGLKVIKAFPVFAKEDLEKQAGYSGTCDYYLFDTKCDVYGGSGKSFDWPLLAHYKEGTPFILSGGIHPESADAINRIKHPLLAGIDLNSRFESAPGIKDTGLLSRFIQEIRNK